MNKENIIEIHLEGKPSGPTQIRIHFDEPQHDMSNIILFPNLINKTMSRAYNVRTNIDDDDFGGMGMTD